MFGLPDMSVFDPPFAIRVDPVLFDDLELISAVSQEALRVASGDHHVTGVTVRPSARYGRNVLEATFSRCCGRGHFSCEYRAVALLDRR